MTVFILLLEPPDTPEMDNLIVGGLLYVKFSPKMKDNGSKFLFALAAVFEK